MLLNSPFRTARYAAWILATVRTSSSQSSEIASNHSTVKNTLAIVEKFRCGLWGAHILISAVVIFVLGSSSSEITGVSFSSLRNSASSASANSLACKAISNFIPRSSRSHIRDSTSFIKAYVSFISFGSSRRFVACKMHSFSCWLIFFTCSCHSRCSTYSSAKSYEWPPMAAFRFSWYRSSPGRSVRRLSDSSRVMCLSSLAFIEKFVVPSAIVSISSWFPVVPCLADFLFLPNFVILEH